MAVEVKVVADKKGLTDFIRCPQIVHLEDSNWQPPIYADEFAFFTPEKNSAFKHCDTILAVAYHNHLPAGRIMGIIHHTYNRRHNENNARFGYFECINDIEIASALIDFVKNWAISHKITSLTGPYGFSDKDPQGFMVEGFGSTPLIDTNCNLPYMNRLMELLNFTPFLDCLTYRFNCMPKLPEVYERVKARLESNNRYKLLEISSKRELKEYIIPVLELTNETYSNLYGFYPLDLTEMHELAKRYMPVLQPRYIKLVLLDGKLAGYVIALPNMSEGFKKAKGKLLPLGWFYILKALKKSKQLDLMLGAVKPELQGLGLEVWMGLKLLDSARKAGIQSIETHLILETNRKMRAVIERIDAQPSKRFRVYTSRL